MQIALSQNYEEPKENTTGSISGAKEAQSSGAHIRTVGL
jgi:hypothetical protein